MVAEADRQGVSPGSEVLREIFAAAAEILVGTGYYVRAQHWQCIGLFVFAAPDLHLEGSDVGNREAPTARGFHV